MWKINRHVLKYHLPHKRIHMEKQSQPEQSAKAFRIPYAQALNPAQLEAVTHTQGPLIVIAGAGSGKTRTLTYRVARLVEEGIAPHTILLLTFTRRAAEQMLKRASLLLDSRCEKVAGGTFHSFANMVLRKYPQLIGFDSKFVVLDRPDAESLIEMLRKEMGFVPQHRSFPRKNTLANIFSKSINKVQSIEDIVFNDYPHLAVYLDPMRELHAEYDRRKTMHAFMDFDDLLIYLRRLLKENETIRQKIASTYRYLMVDEYQDTNQLQSDIIRLLVSDDHNVMVVGDDSQSIYAFRGANFRNIIEFPRLFPGTRIIRLEENYRSVQPILDLANVIIDRAEEKYTKTLFTQKPSGSPPVLVSAADEDSQSRFVADKIEQFRRQGGALEEIAVLFRASFHSFDLEIELTRRGMPFIKVGGFKFMEAAHIKDVLAHLRVLSNPYDRISWYRILLLIDTVGPATAHRIFEEGAKRRTGLMGFLEDLPRKKTAAEGLQRLKAFFSGIDVDALSLAELGASVLEYYTPMLRDKYDDHPKRAKDLEQLLSIMARYSHMERFLTDMALEPPNIGFEGSFTADPLKEDRLTLSTIHSAKGLEWREVFVIWALDGRFPSGYSLDKPEELEEELRLMYVAITRAKERLYIVYPATFFDHGFGTALSRPSRFVDHIPDDLLEKQFVGTHTGRIFDAFDFDPA